MTDRPNVAFIPGFLSPVEADDLLNAIRQNADFKQNYIRLYGMKAIPRLEAWYGSWDYPYSSGVVLKAAPMPSYLQQIIDRIEDADSVPSTPFSSTTIAAVAITSLHTTTMITVTRSLRFRA